MEKEAPAPTAKRLNSPRQFRALSALMKEPRTVRQLWDVAGGTGIPQLIDALRNKGLRIDTIRRAGTDRDSRRCTYGVYTLHPDSRLEAERLLNAYKSQGSGQHDRD